MNACIKNIVIILAMFAIFYFLLIRPQQKRQKAVAQMQSELKKGDAIVTIGVLHGTIESVDETKIVIKSGGSHLTFGRNASRRVVKN
ncbi:preprotein translocase subunit YajC [Bacillus sp. S1-R5C1-FB]|uniref:preprotein translocase subunit YajC n=1 Tax=Bacillus sp. S1-R5C1-FB TaxID=1973491 RepID=UPI000B494FBA|nr:preprotein translocase subunit YajC [Bacillus sp. S1-R5C1-FB]